MKRILSIILALVMCLSAVALLASCGKSAYEIAVENGVMEKIVGEDAFAQMVGSLSMIDEGFVGTLVEVDHDGGAVRVRITVENYED